MRAQEGSLQLTSLLFVVQHFSDSGSALDGAAKRSQRGAGSPKAPGQVHSAWFLWSGVFPGPGCADPLPLCERGRLVTAAQVRAKATAHCPQHTQGRQAGKAAAASGNRAQWEEHEEPLLLHQLQGAGGCGKIQTGSGTPENRSG